MELYRHFAAFEMEVLRLCVWLIILAAIFVPLEFFGRLRAQRIFRRAFGTDVVYYFLSSLLPKLFLVAPLTFLAAVLHRVAPSSFYSAIAGLPLWLRMSAAMIVGEAGAYWGHRWSHEIPWLWRFHAIHHSAEEIDWLVNSRAHPIDLVFTRLCGLVPMYALGLAQPVSNSVDLVPLLVTVIGTVWGFFIHANIKWRFGWLEYILSSPAFHHWHHTNDDLLKINKNYAAMLPWVDQCFGTFYLPKEEWPTKYGTDSPVATSLAGQLLNPVLGEDQEKTQAM